MEVTHFVYEYGENHKTIDMIVTGSDADGHPVGYEVWTFGSLTPSGGQQWLLDGELTVLAHPIASQRRVDQVRRLVTW